MIIATVSRLGTITATGEMLLAGTNLKFTIQTVDASSIQGFGIRTIESQLRGPPGPIQDLTAINEKLATIEIGATANSTDVFLRARSNHTGTQAIDTVSGLQSALDGKATAAQGSKADSAVQPSDLSVVATSGSYVDLSNKPAIPSVPSDIGAATAAQGAKADTAVQPGALAIVATSGSYSDLLSKPSIPSAPSDIGAATAAQGVKADTAVQPTAVGVSIASLVGGVVPSSQLPSYVDDVLEFADFASLPVTGESGKIYVTDTPYTSGGVTSSQFRWAGSAYAPIIASPGSTDAVTEGATNLYFSGSRVLAAFLQGLNTAPDVGTLTGSESLPASRGVGLLQTTLANIATFVTSAFLGFIQSGTGAVARSFLGKLLDMPLSPEDFGAVGDYNYTTGTGTLNTVALQNMLNFASIAGRSIRLKAGAKYRTGDLYGYYDATLNPGYAAKPGRIHIMGNAAGIATGAQEPQGSALVHAAGSTGTLLGILGVFSVSSPGGTAMCVTLERVNLVGATTSASVLHTQDCTELVSLNNMFIRQRNGAGYGWNSENDWGVRVDNVQIRGDDPSDGTWTGKGLYLHSDTSGGQINMWVVTNLDVYKANGIYLGRNGVTQGTFGPLVFIGGQVSYSSDHGVTLGAGVYNTQFIGFQVEQARYNAVHVNSAGGNDLPRNCKFVNNYFTNNGKIADGSTNQFDVYVNDGAGIEFDMCLHNTSNSGYFFNAASAVDLHVRRPYFRTVSTYGAASGYGFNYTGGYTAQNRIHLEDSHFDQNFSNNAGPDAGAVMGLWERNIRRISYATLGGTPSIGLGSTTGLASADILNFNQASAVTVTAILGGRIGQLLTVTFSNTNTTIQHNASTIFLNGGASFTPTSSHSVLVLRQIYTGVWCEVGRSQS